MNKELVEKGKLLEPHVRIGKNGLTSGMVNEIKLQLKKHKLVKVKFLKPTEQSKKEFAAEIAEKTNSELIHQVGFVVVLYRE